MFRLKYLHFSSLQAVSHLDFYRHTKAESSSHLNQKNTEGFALVIALSLLSFVLLLLLSITTLVRVESMQSSNQMQLNRARQNALLSLNIALGDLQKHAGSDQRATASANIEDSTANVSVSGAKHWIGVWGNGSNPQTGISSSPKLLQWLVSGNQENAFSPSADISYAAGSFGQVISASATPKFLPSDPISHLTTEISVADPLSIDSATGENDAVLLVGPNTVGVESGAESEYVVAPLVDISATPSGANGRYAFWIGDEGAKARVNSVDPYMTPTSAMSDADVTAEASSPFRLMSPQRYEIESMDGFQDYVGNDPSLRSIYDLKQLEMIVPNLSENTIKTGFHSLTTASFSVLSDSLRGGLKRDLTYAFARDSLGEYREVIKDPWRDLSHSQPNSMLSGVLDSSDPVLDEATLQSEQGATWEQLRSYARMGGDIDASDRIQPRIQTGDTQGIFPVLVQARLGFVGGKTVEGSVPDTQRFIVRFLPVFVLANPYNVTLEASKYRVRMIFDHAGAGYGVYIGSNVSNEVRHPIWRKTLRELFDGQVYELNCPELQPGQARLFTLGQDETWAAEKVYQFDNEWAETVISLNTEVDVTDDDLSVRGLHAVFSDNGIQKSWRSNYSISNAGAVSGSMTWALTDEDDNVYQRFSNQEARGSGASVYDAGFFSRSGEPRDDPEVRAYYMFKLGDTGNYLPLSSSLAGQELTKVHIYPYYALANIRAPMIARPRWYQSSYQPTQVFSSIIFSQQFYKSMTTKKFGRWFRFGTSDPLLSAEVEWQGVLKEGSLGSGSSSLPQAQMNWPMSDIPRELEGPVSGMVSLGQLQHFNAGGYSDGQFFPPASSPMVVRPSENRSWRTKHVGNPNPIGNSRASVFVQRDKVRSLWPAGSSGEPFYDQSYLLNRQLFDGYFFSTYPQDVSQTFDFRTERLGNSSLVPFRKDIAVDDTEAFRGESAGFDANDVFLPARNLMQKGGFNINSTSVPAWRAFLGALADTEFNGESDLTGPFVRSIHQVGGSSDASDGISENAWTGFRNLTALQLDELAIAIVDQIKQRGPVISLADFINRKLVSDTATNAADGLAGAIQAAIDTTSINRNIADEIQNWNDTTVDVSSLSQVHDVFPYPDQLPMHALEGIAGWLTQADILQALAPLMQARSDTFRIRGYGDVLDPVTQEVQARAWCEAIVQRIPDYIDADNAGAIAQPSTLSTENLWFGRRFVITGFRWLDASEI